MPVLCGNHPEGTFNLPKKIAFLTKESEGTHSQDETALPGSVVFDTKEFDLSKKRLEIDRLLITLGLNVSLCKKIHDKIKGQDREFIKRLKDALKITKESIGLVDRYDRRTIVNICAFFEGEIDKLAGKNLSGDL